ncbi:MAG: hypothetical protein KAJ18_05260 [Candidatus Omnitrophica bacterium]|nr:hypothetical protein [Candidatus Omnitrophota bacterium]
MDKDKKLKMLLPVLVVVSVLVWVPNFKPIKYRRTSISKQAEMSARQEKLLALIVAGSPVEEKKVSRYKEWGSNPFFREAVHVKQAEVDEESVSVKAEQEIVPVKIDEQFVVNGLFWNETKPSAIINDEVVGIGAAIGSYTVVDIRQDVILLNDGVRDFELRISDAKRR